MIPMVARHSTCRTSIRWQDKPAVDEVDDGDDGQSADSSRCSSREDSPGSRKQSQTSFTTRAGPRFPRSKTMAGVGVEDREIGDGTGKTRNGIEVIELKCEQDTEIALQDLLGLRLSGSRSVGVFVQSVHAGSVAAKDGRIAVGDQLLNVEAVSLIGLTPDQVVRVLRSGFSYSTSSVRLTVVHHWAGRLGRPTSQQRILAASKSEGAIAVHSSGEDEYYDTPEQADTGDRRPSVPAGALPGSVASTVEVHPVGNVRIWSVHRPHTQGATKLARPRHSLSVDQSTLTMGDNEEAVMAASAQKSLTDSTSSPVSSDGIDSVLGLYDPTSEQADTVSTLPTRPITSRNYSTAAQRSQRKSSLQFPLVTANDQFDLGIDKGQSIVATLPGSLVKPITLRHRRVSHQGEIIGSAGSTKSGQSGSSKATAVTQLSQRMSPKKESRHVRAWGSDDSLQVASEDEDKFKIGRPSISLHGDQIKQFISSAQRKSIRSVKREQTNEQLPLVSFDQLSRTSPSPTENNRKATPSDSSGQSKSSKGSISSQCSQKLSWQCPVCLDGASRIRRTKRRMMSTPCGHVFCSSCVQDVVGKHCMCPTCRTPIRSVKDVHPIFM